MEGYVESQNLFDFGKQVKWTKQDISQREKLDPVFMAFMNASCFRRYALEYLQEDVNDPELEYRRPLDRSLCCNACNHELGKLSPLMPREKRGEKPSAGSLASHALTYLSSWCKTNAQSLVPDKYRRFDIIPEMFMDSKLQYAVARTFSDVRGKTKDLSFKDIYGLVQKVPELKEWEHFEAKGAQLVTFCITSLAKIKEDWEAERVKKAKEREAKTQRAGSVSAADPARKRTAEAMEHFPAIKTAL